MKHGTDMTRAVDVFLEAREERLERFARLEDAVKGKVG